MEYAFENLVPESDEQIVSIGQNGRGKSAWLKMISIPYIGIRQIVVIDSKHDSIWNGFGKIVTTPTALYRIEFPKTPVAVYRPQGELAHDYDAYDDIFEWIYERENTVVVVDETGKVVKDARTVGKGLDDMCTRGRKRDILRMFGVQRPSGVPRIIFSEASRFYVKSVIDQRDRDTVAGFSDESLKLKIPDRYGMRYCNTKTGEAIYFPKVPH